MKVILRMSVMRTAYHSAGGWVWARSGGHRWYPYSGSRRTTSGCHSYSMSAPKLAGVASLSVSRKGRRCRASKGGY